VLLISKAKAIIVSFFSCSNVQYTNSTIYIYTYISLYSEKISSSSETSLSHQPIQLLFTKIALRNLTSGSLRGFLDGLSEEEATSKSGISRRSFRVRSGRTSVGYVLGGLLEELPSPLPCSVSSGL
jgi:hypothetical protein